MMQELIKAKNYTLSDKYAFHLIFLYRENQQYTFTTP